MADGSFPCVRAQYSNCDPFAVLGLEVGCTFDDVKNAYKSHALQLHPDKLSEKFSVVQQTELFQLLGAAYEKIQTDPGFVALLSKQSGKERKASAVDGCTHDDDSDPHPARRVRKRVSKTKDRFAAARQAALQSKWKEDLRTRQNDAQGGRIGAEKVIRRQEKPGWTSQRSEQAAKKARSRNKNKARTAPVEAHGHEQKKPQSDVKKRNIEKRNIEKRNIEKRKMRERSEKKKRESRERSEKKKTACAEGRPGAAPRRPTRRQQRRAQGEGEVVEDSIQEVSLPDTSDPKPNRRERRAAARCLAMNSEPVSREQRFESRVSDPLETVEVMTGRDGKLSLNADIVTAEDWDEDPVRSSMFEAELRLQWALVHSAKDAKLQRELSEQRLAASQAAQKTKEKRKKPINSVGARLKVVDPVGGETMDYRVRKALLSGKGNAVEALPSGKARRQRIWALERDQMLLEEALLKEGDWFSILKNDTGKDFCSLGGHSTLLLNVRANAKMNGGLLVQARSFSALPPSERAGAELGAFVKDKEHSRKIAAE